MPNTHIAEMMLSTIYVIGIQMSF